MDETDKSSGSLGEHADRAGEALAKLADEAPAAAAVIEDAFERSGEAIERAMTSAARTGGDVFAKMAQSILLALADLAIDRIVGGPLMQLLGSLESSAPFLRPRADGGPVLPGGAYLVGERGPELFVPASAGAIEPSAAGAVTVHFHLAAGADAESLRRSQGQIATLVARAVAHGRKRL